MKLIARKSMIALGTAAALSVTALTAPAMAADETTNTTTTEKAGTEDGNADSNKSGTEDGNADSNKSGTEDGNGDEKSSGKADDNGSGNQEVRKQEEADAAYAERYSLVFGQLKRYQASYYSIEKLVQERAKEVGNDSEAAAKIRSAEYHLSTADTILHDAWIDLGRFPEKCDPTEPTGDNNENNEDDKKNTTPLGNGMCVAKNKPVESNGIAETGTKNSSEYGQLNAIKDTLRTVNTELNAAKTDAESAKPFKCDDGSSNEGADNQSGGSHFGGSSLNSLSSGDGFGSLFKRLGSSGQMEVYKDGKKRCVSKAEYYSEKLTKVVAILGTVFTLITTMTKISDTIQKQAMPKK